MLRVSVVRVQDLSNNTFASIGRGTASAPRENYTQGQMLSLSEDLFTFVDLPTVTWTPIGIWSLNITGLAAAFGLKSLDRRLANGFDRSWPYQGAWEQPVKWSLFFFLHRAAALCQETCLEISTASRTFMKDFWVALLSFVLSLLLFG